MSFDFVKEKTCDVARNVVDQCNKENAITIWNFFYYKILGNLTLNRYGSYSIATYKPNDERSIWIGGCFWLAGAVATFFKPFGNQTWFWLSFYKFSFWFLTILFLLSKFFGFSFVRDTTSNKFAKLNKATKFKLVKKDLEKIIKTNRWYIQGGDGVTDYSVKFEYTVNEDNSIVVCAHLDGSKFQDKLLDLEEVLSNRFIRECERIVHKGFVEYRLTELDNSYFSYDERCYGMPMFGVNPEYISFSNKLRWEFRKHPHALVVGNTGTGKSFFLYYLIRQFLSIGADVKAIDVKKSDLYALVNVLGEKNVVCEKNHGLRLLREANEEITRRNTEFFERNDFRQGKDYHDYGYKPYVVFFDEFAAFMADCSDKKDKDEAYKYVRNIIFKGRSAGVFIVIAIQRPDANVLSGDVRDQLGLRVALGQLSPEGNAMVFRNEYRDLQVSKASIVKPKNYDGSKCYAGVGYLYTDGMTSPKEFYSPVSHGSYDFYEDCRCILGERRF